VSLETLDLMPEAESRLKAAGEAITRQGFLWRFDNDDRDHFFAIHSNEEAMRYLLSFSGQQLWLDSRVQVYRVLREDASARLVLTALETEFLVLLVHLRYERVDPAKPPAEQSPNYTYGEISTGYQGYKTTNVRAASSIEQALRRFHAMKLIRTTDGRRPSNRNATQKIQMLPVLETIVPPDALAAWLDEFQLTPSDTYSGITTPENGRLQVKEGEVGKTEGSIAKSGEHLDATLDPGADSST
jgi:hypothetical protein